MSHDPVDDLRQHMRHALEHLGQTDWRTGRGGWRPNVDIYQTADAVVVVLEAAGIAPGSIDINVDGRKLTVSGRRVPILRPGARTIHHLEIAQGAFHLTVELPLSVDAERSQAASQNGLLEIVLPLPSPVHPRIASSTMRSES